MDKRLDVGIDKIWLNTYDFKIENASIFATNSKKEAGQTDLDLPLLANVHGNEIRASQMTFNTFKRKHEVPYYVSISQPRYLKDPMFNIQFNPSKILDPIKLVIDPKEVRMVCDQIQDSLDEFGIKVNLENALQTRLDFAKQDFMKRPLQNYNYGFDFIGGKRMKKVGYEDGYTFYNKSHEACFYDKGLESKNDAFIGMMRVEQRLKDSNTINKFTGIKTLGNLLRSDNEQWNECYKNYLNNTIFHQIKNKSILDIRSEVERFQKIQSDNSRYVPYKYLVSISLNHQISKMGSLEFLFTVMKEAGCSRSNISETRKELIKVMEYAKPAKQVSVMTLINELQKKFAA
ncbi:MAG: hypothetical protein WBO76_03035 [Saprospiraceae bacterium]